MIIDGKQIAFEILEDLKKQVEKLKEKSISPTLAVILIGDEKSSATYVRQKELKAKTINANTTIYNFDNSVTHHQIETLIKQLDKDPKVHGIILQRPAPQAIKVEKLEELISPIKEIDGFGKDSLYPVPVAQAVVLMLKDVYENLKTELTFIDWLKSASIVILGKGETAGKPVADLFKAKNIEPIVVDSKTLNRGELLKKADIVISAVGKINTLKAEELKKGVVLISVGLSRNDQEKLEGDYNEEEIQSIASFYSPTPGGVGPVNVACLMQNLIKACEMQS